MMESSAEALKKGIEWEIIIIESSDDLVFAQMPILRETASHDPL